MFLKVTMKERLKRLIIYSNNNFFLLKITKENINIAKVKFKCKL